MNTGWTGAFWHDTWTDEFWHSSMKVNSKSEFQSRKLNRSICVSSLFLSLFLSFFLSFSLFHSVGFRRGYEGTIRGPRSHDSRRKYLHWNRSQLGSGSVRHLRRATRSLGGWQVGISTVSDMGHRYAQLRQIQSSWNQYYRRWFYWEWPHHLPHLSLGHIIWYTWVLILSLDLKWSIFGPAVNSRS